MITCPEGQKKLGMPLKQVTLLYPFLYKVIPSLVWERRRRVYTEQYTRMAIHLRKDVTTFTASLFTICNNGGADMVHCCSDEATGWTIRGLNSGRGKKYFSSPKRPGRLCGPPNLLFNTYRIIFWIKRSGRELCHEIPTSAEIQNEESCGTTFD